MKKTIILFLMCSLFSLNNVKAVDPNTPTTTFTFVLTHLGNIKLKQKAHFYAGDTKTWKLDFRNGDKIYYTITGRVGNDPMCGLTSKDNLGDNCAICITKKSGDNVEIELRYRTKTFTYRGYISR